MSFDIVPSPDDLASRKRKTIKRYPFKNLTPGTGFYVIDTNEQRSIRSAVSQYNARNKTNIVCRLQEDGRLFVGMAADPSVSNAVQSEPDISGPSQLELLGWLAPQKTGFKHLFPSAAYTPEQLKNFIQWIEDSPILALCLLDATGLTIEILGE